MPAVTAGKCEDGTKVGLAAVLGVSCVANIDTRVRPQGVNNMVGGAGIPGSDGSKTILFFYAVTCQFSCKIGTVSRRGGGNLLKPDCALFPSY